MNLLEFFMGSESRKASEVAVDVLPLSTAGEAVRPLASSPAVSSSEPTPGPFRCVRCGAPWFSGRACPSCGARSLFVLRGSRPAQDRPGRGPTRDRASSSTAGAFTTGASGGAVDAARAFRRGLARAASAFPRCLP